MARRAKKTTAKKTTAKSTAKKTTAKKTTAKTTAKNAVKNAVKVAAAKGRPMLTWVGKRPLASVVAFPAQHIESFDPTGELEKPKNDEFWHDWPEAYPRGGLLFHGDNKEVLGHLLANGFRGKVDLIYIDPPFDSGADYVRRVSLRGEKGAVHIEGEGYALGEQIQYTDIWANDEYLQFMYERLLLLKELLRDGGSLWLHCDWHKSHHLRGLLDEVFGSDNLVNEVVWQRTDPHNDAVNRLGWVHDSIYWYAKGGGFTYNWQSVVEALSPAALKEYNLVRRPDGSVVDHDPSKPEAGRRFKLDDCTWKGTDPERRFEWRGARPSDKRVWPYDPEGMDAALARGEFYLRDPEKGAARCRVSFLDERQGQLLQTIWTEVGRMKGGVEYPTEKPRALLSRIIAASSNRGDLVLDCFLGSGTFALAAQGLGRRWIGCDINKGAVQTSAKRLQDVIGKEVGGSAQGSLTDSESGPVQLAFTTWRVNDYELQIQHNEAVELACQHVGVQRTRTDAFFDGTLGKNLVKIVPFTHPLSPVDLESIKTELAARPDEDRSVTVICLGVELAAKKWIDDWNRMRRGRNAINRIEYIELRSDAKHGGWIKHEPASAKVAITRENGRVVIQIKDFVSPAIVERLRRQTGVTKPKIDDWRAMVDSVMIDSDYDGKVFNVALSDVPARKQDLVAGRYELPAADTATVAVKITDMLGEEVLITDSG